MLKRQASRLRDDPIAHSKALDVSEIELEITVAEQLRMTRSFSTYLDLLRFLAALIVFIVHANYERFTGGLPGLWRLSGLGNDAVMVFFVLSGFVISYVADKKEPRLIDYSTSRFARLYSVVVPALLLTVVADWAGSHIYPPLYQGPWFESDNPIWRLFSNLFFINELWFIPVRPFSNGPFWSLGYEFWYYVIFAAAIYAPPPWRWPLMLSVALVMGPKILLLLPVWLLGVVAYRLATRHSIPLRTGILLACGSLIVYLIFHLMDLPDLLMKITQDALGREFVLHTLKWSGQFLSSYIIGFLIALHILGVYSILSAERAPILMLERPIRYVASYTFALYLFHYPLLQFFAAVAAATDHKEAGALLVIVATTLSVWALASLTEPRKSDIKRWLLRNWSEMHARTKA